MFFGVILSESDSLPRDVLEKTAKIATGSEHYPGGTIRHGDSQDDSLEVFGEMDANLNGQDQCGIH